MLVPGALDVSRIAAFKDENLDDVRKFLDEWNIVNVRQTIFSSISVETREALAQFINEKSQEKSLAKSLLCTIRLISRDKNDLEKLLTTDVCEMICVWSGLTDEINDDVNKDIAIEAAKTLNNTLFHSLPMRQHFAKRSMKALESLLVAFATDSFQSFPFFANAKSEELLSISHHFIKIAFIETALMKDVQNQWSKSLPVLDALYSLIEEALRAIQTPSPNAIVIGRADEAMKTLFNLFCHANEDLLPKDYVTKFNLLFREIITTPGVPSDLEQNSVNMLSTLPLYLIPAVVCTCLDTSKGDNTKSRRDDEAFENYDMNFTTAMMNALSSKLTNVRVCVEKMLVTVTVETGTDKEPELLGTYLTVLIKLCTISKQARRYCRLKILPPLKDIDVERRPDQGNTLRNQLVRLMMQTTCTKELASEFLFILCKKSVQRLIKYTGFGHSAGLLANSGLLGQVNARRRDSDSEDSETEEYNAVRNHVNPVTGTFFPQEPSAIAGMSEEQKEYEAMKLVNAMSKMMDAGIVKPGTIGEDGRIQEVSHVCQLAKNAPEKEDSDSD